MRLHATVLVSVLVCGCGDDGGGGGSAADAAVGTDASGQSDAPSGSTVVNEVEPNDERDQATQLTTRGTTLTINGTCRDDTDLDYYNAPAGTTGPYTAVLSWQAGAFQMGFDPEDGFAGSFTKSTTSPITVSGQVFTPSELPAPQFAVDCYNDGVSPPANLAYTLTLTLP